MDRLATLHDDRDESVSVEWSSDSPMDIFATGLMNKTSRRVRSRTTTLNEEKRIGKMPPVDANRIFTCKGWVPYCCALDHKGPEAEVTREQPAVQIPELGVKSRVVF